MDLVVKTFKNYRKGKLRYLADFALHLFPKKMRTHPSSLLANVKIQREVKEKKNQQIHFRKSGQVGLRQKVTSGPDLEAVKE